MKRIIAGLAVCLGGYAGSAGAQSAVATGDIGGARFEVVGKSYFRAREYWCEAALHARAQGSEGRIYLVRGLGPSELRPGRRAAVFTLDPQAAGITPARPQTEVSLAVPGDNMSVTMGRSLCTAGGADR